MLERYGQPTLNCSEILATDLARPEAGQPPFVRAARGSPVGPLAPFTYPQPLANPARTLWLSGLASIC